MSLLFSLLLAAHAQTAILTQRGDVSRSSVNRHEAVLNHDNVAKSFGKLFELPVDEQIYAQPLYVPGLKLANGTVKNVVFVATMGSHLYAFDADKAPTRKTPYLWRASLAPAAGKVGVSSISDFRGILSTPVIDLASNVIYASCLQVGKKDDAAFKLFKIALDSGKILDSVTVEGSMPGRGIDAIDVAGESRVPFVADKHLQRPGLLLHKGYVHLAFASHGDEGPFHGWIFSYRATDLKGGPSFLTSPVGLSNMIGAGIWQSGMGLTVDEQGYVYASTGNGDFSEADHDWGNSMLKLEFSPATVSFTKLDHFTPFNQKELNALDLDVGSSGVLFVPPHFLIGAGKTGKFYVLDRDHLGGYTPEKNGDVGAIQVMQATEPAFNKIINGEFMWNIHGAPVQWDGQVYVMGESDPAKSFRMDLQTGRIDETPTSRSTFEGPIGMPGGFITLTLDETHPADSAIVWVVHHLEGSATQEPRPGLLHALDAKDLSHEFWNSDMKKGDSLGTFAKFVVPTVANGKVFMATFDKKVIVYGLKPAKR
jgi:hypothetical protein